MRPEKRWSIGSTCRGPACARAIPGSLSTSVVVRAALRIRWRSDLPRTSLASTRPQPCWKAHAQISPNLACRVSAGAGGTTTARGRHRRLIFMSMMLHHLDDRQSAAQRMPARFRPDGRVFIRNTTRDSVYPHPRFFPGFQAIVDARAAVPRGGRGDCSRGRACAFAPMRSYRTDSGELAGAGRQARPARRFLSCGCLKRNSRLGWPHFEPMLRAAAPATIMHTSTYSCSAPSVPIAKFVASCGELGTNFAIWRTPAKSRILV